MAGALTGIRVLDLSWGIAGPMGVLMLAEHGADVVKVEPPGGDPFRAQPGNTVWNRSRRSIEIDLKDEADRAAFLRLVDDADVVVESFAPGTTERLGIGPEVLRARNPRLIHCSVRGYPPGHRAASRSGYDALVQARSGLQHEQPGWRPGPVHLHFPAPSMGACFLAAIGVLAALVEREQTGMGQQVETSLYQGALLYTTQIWQWHEHADAAFRTLMGQSYPPGIHQGSIYSCGDGRWVHAATMSGRTPTKTFEDVLGLDPVDPMRLYTDEAARAAHDVRVRAAISSRQAEELLTALHDAGLGGEEVVSMLQAFDHPQLLANGMVVAVDDPERGPTRQLGVPAVLSVTPGAVVGPQPLPGQHTDEVLGAPAREPRTWPAVGDTGQRSGPLAGTVVLDLGQFLAGPVAPMVLAALGADVVKVEPVRDDAMRRAGKPFLGCQQGKRGIAVDLKSDEGRELVLRLVERADVVHHNMTKGTAARLGIDEPVLRARRPDPVHCNTYAYGPTGPMSDFGGLDPLFQAACGLEHEAGVVAEGGAPLYLRFGVTDTANGLVSTVGVLAARYHRARTGEGQDVWTSLLNSAAVFGSDLFLEKDGGGPQRPGLDVALTGPSPCYRLYATQEGWVQVAACTTSAWTGLCRTLGRPELATDARAVSFDDRVRHRDSLGPLLEQAFLQRTAVAWVHLLDDAGVPAEVAVDTQDGELVLFDADNERLGLVTEMAHPRLGRLRQFGRLVSFSGSVPAPRLAPPMLGQHTREVLRAAGVDDSAFDDLLTRGIVYEPDADYAWQT